jgi:PBP1b-binding outer membrane lipoprotein LpoB
MVRILFATMMALFLTGCVTSQTAERKLKPAKLQRIADRPTQDRQQHFLMAVGTGY